MPAIATSILLLAGSVSSQNRTPGFPKHPSYNVITMHPDSFQPQVAGMDFMPDGKLVIVTWKGKSVPMWQAHAGQWGEAFLVEGMEGIDKNALKVTKIATGFKDAQGVAVVNGSIYVGDVDRIVKLTEPDARGMYQGKQEIGKYPSSSNGWFEYSFGPAYQGGKFYMAQAVHVKNSGDTAYQKVADRSTVISIPLAGGNYEVVASGFRAPDGIGVGPDGVIFVTDNQGGWLPTSKLIAIKPGRFYGFNALPPSKFQSLPMTQPTLWMPYREINDSPTEPALMTQGLFAGHMFYGDIGRGGLYRAFLEKVLDPVTNALEFQGAIFPFCGGLEVGMHRLRIRGEVIYAGGLGSGSQSNQGWAGTKFGLQKIIPIPGKVAFEMLAVRSRKQGMEIEFTKPLAAGGEAAANFKAVQWRYIPVVTYGGGKQPNENLMVSSTLVSPDRKKVYLQIPGIKDKGHVVKLTATGLKAQDGEDLWYRDTYYTVRAISQTNPFDVPVGISAEDRTRMDPASVGVQRIVGGGLKVRLPETGSYRVEIADLQGKSLAMRSGASGAIVFEGSLFRTGLYLLQVSGEGRRLVRPLAF
jgi:hypothetical protein